MWVLLGRQPTSSAVGTAACPQPPRAAHLEQAALDAHDLLPLRRHACQAKQLHLEHGRRLLRVDFHILEHLPGRGGHGAQLLGGGPASRRQGRWQRHRRCQCRSFCSSLSRARCSSAVRLARGRARAGGASGGAPAALTSLPHLTSTLTLGMAAAGCDGGAGAGRAADRSRSPRAVAAGAEGAEGAPGSVDRQTEARSARGSTVMWPRRSRRACFRRCRLPPVNSMIDAVGAKASPNGDHC